MGILTSVVGSYPAKKLEDAIDAQLRAGIDVVTDGQTSDTMIGIFASKISGIKLSNDKKKYKIVGELVWPEGGIIAQDQIYAKAYIKEKKLDAMLKGVVTGPYTLAKDCRNSYYSDEKEVAFAFAGVLNKELCKLQEIVDVLQIDEPTFSEGIPNYVSELFKVLTTNIHKELVLHTHAGKTTETDLPTILELPVQVLSYDFAEKQRTIELLCEYDFEQSISLGCINTGVDYLPGPTKIAERIKYAIKKFGEEKIKYVTPDCGLRLKKPHIANEIMQRVVAARDSIKTKDKLMTKDD